MTSQLGLVIEEDNLAEAFIADTDLDGESDDDENEVRTTENNVQLLPPVFQPISNDRLCNPTFSMSYPFEPGNEQDYIEKYRQMSAFDIVLSLFEVFKFLKIVPIIIKIPIYR